MKQPRRDLINISFYARKIFITLPTSIFESLSLPRQSPSTIKIIGLSYLARLWDRLPPNRYSGSKDWDKVNLVIILLPGPSKEWLQGINRNVREDNGSHEGIIFLWKRYFPLPKVFANGYYQALIQTLIWFVLFLGRMTSVCNLVRSISTVIN